MSSINLEKLKNTLSRHEFGDPLNSLIKSVKATRSRASHPAVPLSDTIIGIDTNALLRLPIYKRGTDIIDYLTNHKFPTIIPGQVIQEFWNNEQNVIDSTINNIEIKYKNLISEIKKIGDISPVFLDKFEEVLNEFKQQHEDAFIPSNITETERHLNKIKENSITAFVPRDLFFSIAKHRHSTKTPPGFKDSGSGDFYVWADFLYGLMLAREQGIGFQQIAIINNEKKIDWRRGEAVHPILIEEAEQLFGVPFEIWDFSTMVSLIDSAPPMPAAVRPTAVAPVAPPTSLISPLMPAAAASAPPVAPLMPAAAASAPPVAPMPAAAASAPPVAPPTPPAI